MTPVAIGALVLMVLGVFAIGAAVLSEFEGPGATGRWSTFGLAGLGLALILGGATLLPDSD